METVTEQNTVTHTNTYTHTGAPKKKGRGKENNGITVFGHGKTRRVSFISR